MQSDTEIMKTSIEEHVNEIYNTYINQKVNQGQYVHMKDVVRNT